MGASALGPPITGVVRARSETEAAWMLAEGREGTRAIAGGTDLMLQMDRGRASPSALVDIRRAGMDAMEFPPGARSPPPLRKPNRLRLTCRIAPQRSEPFAAGWKARASSRCKVGDCLAARFRT